MGVLKFCLILLFVTFCYSIPYARSSAKGSLSFDNFIKELVTASSSLSSKNRIRIAVFDFTSTSTTAESSSLFGGYFAEHLVSSLSADTRFKVFERKRLDAVTHELALNQTGLINEAVAKKIGELAPIDYLLTGTFTKLKNAVEVNSRILDVVTGEIQSAFNRKIILTDDLAALFPEPLDQTTKNIQEESPYSGNSGDICDAPIAKLKPAYKNNALSDIVNILVTVPLTSPCNYLHSEAVRFFKEKRYLDKKYSSFFLKEIQNAGDPDKYSSAIGSGLFYFGIDGAIDESEWTCAKTMFKRSNKCNNYMRSIIESKPVDVSPEPWYQLIDDYISSGEMFCGAPGSSDRSSAFLCLLPSMIEDTSQKDLTQYWFENHAAKLKGDKVNEALTITSECYHPDFVVRVDTILYKHTMSQIVFFERLCSPDEKNARTILSFINKLENAAGVTGYKEWRPFFRKQLDMFGDSCRENIQKQLEIFPENGYLEVAFPFCLRHGIHVDGRIPSMDELLVWLSDRSSQKRYQAAELLSESGESTVAVLPQLRKILERSLAADEDTRDPQIESWLLTAIVNSNTSDPAILSFIISLLDQPQSSGLPEKTKELIGVMGSKMLPLLKKNFQLKRAETRILIIESIKMMGTQGAEAKEWLKGLRAGSYTNIDEKDAIDDALEAIGG